MKKIAELEGCPAVVLGFGESGRAAARLLLAQGARVTICDEREEAGTGAAARLLREAGAVVLQGPGARWEGRPGLFVASPGIPPQSELWRAAVAEGVPVWGEIELAGRAFDGTVVAVTGTNGKSTTTELAAAVLQAGGKEAVACGNIGLAFSTVAAAPRPVDVAVVEVSSFQLETIHTFRPRIAAYLNFTPDHLDRYATLEEYRAAKDRIFLNMGPEDDAVVRSGLEWPGLKSRRTTFSAEDRGADYQSEDGWLWAHGQPRLRQGETRLNGPHNAENLLAAMAVGDLLGVPGEAQRRACCRYKPLPHRMEFVGEHGAVCYLNDSKATNPDAVVRALAGQVRPVILIAGGKDKGFDYGVLAPEVGRICREVLLVGEAAGRLEGALGGVKPCRRAGTVEQAVEMAAAAAVPGDLVLLSPGCSSYDQFRNFEERGERFRQAVARLPSQPTPTRRNA